MVSTSVSVVVCTYADARQDGLHAALQSLRLQDPPPEEVIVVVDHNPALAAVLRRECTEIVIQNQGERGLSTARNTGVSVARGEIVAFLDDDATAAPGWIDALITGYERALVLGVGGEILPRWSSEQPAWFPEEFNWVVGCTYKGMPRVRKPVRNLIGANMSFRRHVFDELGGFRSGIGRIGALPFGCEETEFCIRLRHHWPAAVLLYEPRALVHHHVPAARESWRYFRSRCFAEGRSKAYISRYVGVNHGTTTERDYTLRTLPRGAVQGLVDMLARRDWSGAARAGAIAAGLAITTAGFTTAMVSDRLRPGSGRRHATNSVADMS